MFYEEETPRYAGSKVVAAVLAIPGLLLIAAGAVGLGTMLLQIINDPADAIAPRAMAGAAALLLAAGIALLGATVVILLLVRIAQAQFRTQRYLEELESDHRTD